MMNTLVSNSDLMSVLVWESQEWLHGTESSAVNTQVCLFTNPVAYLGGVKYALTPLVASAGFSLVAGGMGSGFVLGGISLLAKVESAILSLQAEASVVYVKYALSNTVYTQSMDVALAFLEASDLFLLLGELAAVLFLVSLLTDLKHKLFPGSLGYDDVVTYCQVRGISLVEVFGLVTFSLGFVFFDMFSTVIEDDVFEAISYVFALVILCAVALIIIGVDVQYYYLISSISGAEPTLRILYADLVNNVLCLLRVFFCWVRYIFYDLQAELVDFAFHYTELNDELALEGLFAEGANSTTGLWAYLLSLGGVLLLVFFDVVAILVQILIGTFKLALALFLFWLVLDLFLLRTLAHAESVRAMKKLRAHHSQGK